MAMKPTRDALAILLALISSIALALGVTGSWVRDNVVSPQGFIDVVGPMASDRAVQQDFAESALADIAPDLPVPDWARDKVEEILASQVHVVTDSDAYGEIWVASMRDLHSELMQGGRAQLTADIAPVWDHMAQPIDDLLPFGWEVPVPKSTVITLTEFDATWFSHLVTLAESATLFLVLGFASALGAVLLGSRRLFALGAVGLGWLGAGFGLWFALSNARVLLPQGITEEKFVGPVLTAFAERAAGDLTSTSTLGMGVGGGLLVIAILAAVTLTAVRVRSEKRAGVERPLGDKSIRYDAYDL